FGGGSGEPGAWARASARARIRVRSSSASAARRARRARLSASRPGRSAFVMAVSLVELVVGGAQPPPRAVHARGGGRGRAAEHLGDLRRRQLLGGEQRDDLAVGGAQEVQGPAQLVVLADERRAVRVG